MDKVVRLILLKVVFLVFAVTMAMVLIDTGDFIGYLIYGKEGIEFIMLMAYLKRRGKW